MKKLKALSRIVLAAIIIAGIASPLCRAAGRDKSQTRIIRLWLRVERNRTCLFFDAEGPRPTRIGPASESGISVFFSKMLVRLPDRSFKGKAAVREVKFRRGSGFFEVLFRWKNTSVTYHVRKLRYGRYVLTLFLTPPHLKEQVNRVSPDEPKTVDFIANAAEKAPAVTIGKVKTSQLFGSDISTQVRDAFANEIKSATVGASPSARKTKPGTNPFVEPDKNGLALYARANQKFEDCSRDLTFCASDIIEEYREALKAGPQSSQAPLAIYRLGLAYYVMGKYLEADRYFKTVTSRWPDNPAACRSWIGRGNICLKKEAYVEAMEDFRWAEMGATGKDDQAAADYALGKTYEILGAHKDALAMLRKCLAKAPDYYIKNPRVLRYIGDAEFGLGDLEIAKQVLLRYVNYQESDPDQDIILAKIAEILLKQGQVTAAKKMYDFVHKYYADSDGDIICRIRAAELMEKTDPDKATAMYERLRNKDLSPSLRSIVLVKLAELELKKCDLEHGLELMNQAFPLNSDSAPPGIAALRQRVLCDLVSQYYASQNFDKVVKLVNKYKRNFNTINLPGTMEEIAESYARQKSYSNALETYDKLIAQQKGVNLDGILLRCAVYALRMRDYNRALGYCQAAQSGALKYKKNEILGLIYYHNEQYGDAIDCFEKVLQNKSQLDIKDPNSYAAFGYSLYQMKKYGQAVPILKTALLNTSMDNDTRRSLLVTLSDCFKQQQQYGQAADTLATAIQVSGGEEKNELLYRLSKLYVAAGESDLAVQSLNQIKAANNTFWSAVAQQELNTINIAAGTGGNQQ